MRHESGRRWVRNRESSARFRRTASRLSGRRRVAGRRRGRCIRRRWRRRRRRRVAGRRDGRSILRRWRRRRRRWRRGRRFPPDARAGAGSRGRRLESAGRRHGALEAVHAVRSDGDQFPTLVAGCREESAHPAEPGGPHAHVFPVRVRSVDGSGGNSSQLRAGADERRATGGHGQRHTDRDDSLHRGSPRSRRLAVRRTRVKSGRPLVVAGSSCGRRSRVGVH